MDEAPPAAWIEQLDTLLALLDTSDATDAAASSPEVTSEQQLYAYLSGLDPELLAFLVGQVSTQDSPQAAALLERLASLASTPDQVRQQARAAHAEMADRGVLPLAPETEQFVAGWVQQQRERGEQILLLGWRMPSGRLDALVFLLDWRGDGLKDFYRTRELSEAEWRQLVEHNGAKGAALLPVALGEARALLETALAESKRFSRPVPREYKIESAVVARRVLEVEYEAGGAASSGDPVRYVTPELAAQDVVAAYIAALHFRDYALAVALLAPEHPLRANRTLDEAATALRLELKHAPRRDAEARLATRPTPEATRTPSTPAVTVDEMVVDAQSAGVAVERTGRRTRIEYTEQYRLHRVEGGWMIAAIESVIDA